MSCFCILDDQNVPVILPNNIVINIHMLLPITNTILSIHTKVDMAVQNADQFIRFVRLIDCVGNCNISLDICEFFNHRKLAIICKKNAKTSIPKNQCIPSNKTPPK